MAYKGKIPLYSRDGNSYAMVDNFTFKGTIRFVGFRRGRSAAHFVVQFVNTDNPAIDGIEYDMFLVYALDVIKSKQITKGTVYGEWAFYKRGSNFSIGLA